MKKPSYAYLFLLLATASCGTAYAPAPVSVYAPAPNIFMLKEKGEFRGNLHYQLSSRETNSGITSDVETYAHGAGLNLAYAVSDHWAITAGYNGDPEKQKHFDDVLRYKRSALQLGAGYFTSINEKRRLYADIYAGYHYGSNRMDYTFDYFRIGTKYYNASQSGFYIQPGIFVAFNNRMKLGVSIKNSVIWFNRTGTNFPEEITEYYYPELSTWQEKPLISVSRHSILNFRFPKQPHCAAIYS